MVLIIDSAKRNARSVCDIFYYMGIPSFAASPSEALSEISPIYKAALILDPEKLADAGDFVTRLRRYNSLLPVFAISAEPMSKSMTHLFDGCYSESISSAKLVEEIIIYQINKHLPIIGNYKLAGINASCDTYTPTVFDKSINLTKTETMILRYLICTYPNPTSAQDILKYAFKQTKKPELASIRTHISVMNKKFRDVRGRNLFLGIPGVGYVVSTPEILSEIKKAN